MQLFVPLLEYFSVMEFSRQEWVNGQMLSHIFHGLGAVGLIDDSWQYGNQQSLAAFVGNGNITGDGIVCTPSALGVELLLWAFGHGDKELDFALTPDFFPKIEGMPRSVPNSVPTKGTEQ